MGAQRKKRKEEQAELKAKAIKIFLDLLVYLQAASYTY